MLYAYTTGEFERMRQLNSINEVGSFEWGWTKVAVLLGNGLIAFGLNIVSLSANRKVGALNMTVAGMYLPSGPFPKVVLSLTKYYAANVKQVLTIVFAVAIFDLTITTLNALGILVTLMGGAWYAYEEHLDKTRSHKFRRHSAGRAAFDPVN